MTYGRVVPAPGAVRIISLPFECRIETIFKNQGESVSPGDLLLKVSPSPDSTLKIKMAQIAYSLAKEKLKQVKKGWDLRLSTKQELLRAQQAFQEARIRLEALERIGLSEGKMPVRADRAGIVAKLYVQEGAIVPPGEPLLRIVANGVLEVRLGVKPKDLFQLEPGKEVKITPVSRPKVSVMAKIRAISSLIDSTTGLVEVFVVSSCPEKLLLNEYVCGEIAIEAKRALLAPRSSVLPEGDRYILFTVKDGRAKQHLVSIGLENGKEIQVIGRDLKPGDKVVSLGNYELKDGMAVHMEED